MSCQIPTRNCKYLAERYIWFFLKDEDFFLIHQKCSVDLQKFPASNVRQLAKKMEASKATTHHVKQLASDPQLVQINLMRLREQTTHQTREQNTNPSSQDQRVTRGYSSEHKQQAPPYKKKFYPNQAYSRKDRCSKCRDSRHVEGFKSPARKFQCKTCNRCDHFASFCYKKKVSFKSTTPKVHQLQVGVVYMQEDSIYGQSEDLISSDGSFCLQVKIQHTQAKSKIPTPHHSYYQSCI